MLHDSSEKSFKLILRIFGKGLAKADPKWEDLSNKTKANAAALFFISAPSYESRFFERIS